MARTGAQRAGQRKKSIEEVVAYALGHRTRILVLHVLNQGAYTASELAEIIDEPLNNVSNHIRELLDAGSIELAETKARRNWLQHRYRAVERVYYSDEEAAQLTPQQRKVTAGFVIQSMMSEVMAGLWAGKMHDDPDGVWLVWDALSLDAQGRQELADEQKRSWKRLSEIEVESTNRRAISGEDSVSIVVAQLGFERGLRAPQPSRSADGE